MMTSIHRALLTADGCPGGSCWLGVATAVAGVVGVLALWPLTGADVAEGVGDGAPEPPLPVPLSNAKLSDLCTAVIKQTENIQIQYLAGYRTRVGKKKKSGVTCRTARALFCLFIQFTKKEP